MLFLMSANPNYAFKHRLAAYGRAFCTAYQRVNRVTYHVFGALCKLLLLAYFLFCVLFLTLRYVVLPHIDDYKGAIERIASHAIGNPVTILWMSAITGLLMKSYGWQKTFILEGIPSGLWAFVWMAVVRDRPAQAKWLSAETSAQIERQLARMHERRA